MYYYNTNFKIGNFSSNAISRKIIEG